MPRVATIVAALVALVMVAHASPARSASNAELARWISSTEVVEDPSSRPSGALAQYPDATLRAVSGYWGSFAALGLARAGDPAGLTAAWEWLGWYQSRMDASGIVADVELSTRSVADTTAYSLTARRGASAYDSADGYAALFILAANEAYQASNDDQQLRSLSVGIRRATKLLVSLQDTRDGLVWNLPPKSQRPGDSREAVKLLMDQAEVYAALSASAELAAVVGDRALARQAGERALMLRRGVAGLWDPAESLYSWAKFADGTVEPTSWQTWYPDALAQAWVLAIGNGTTDVPLVPRTRASSLAKQLGTTWPEWSNPEFSPGAADGRVAGTSSGALEYQPLVGVALAAGDPQRRTEAALGVERLERVAEAAARPWPFSVGVAGQVMFARDVLAPRPAAFEPGNLRAVSFSGLTGMVLAQTA